jgi:hypothetical protein
MVKPYSLANVIISVVLLGCGRPGLKVNQLYGEWRHADQGFVLPVTLLADGKYTIAREPFQSATLSIPASKRGGMWGLTGSHEIWTSEGSNPPIVWHDVSVRGDTLRCRIDDVWFSYIRVKSVRTI